MKKQFIIDFIYYSLILLLAFIFFKYILPIIFPIFLGVLIFLFLKPAAVFLRKSFKINQRTANIIVISLFYLLFSVIFAIICVNLLDDIKALSLKIPDFYTFLSNYDFTVIKNKIDYFLLKYQFISQFSSVFSFFATQITSFLGNFSIFLATFASNIVKGVPLLFFNTILTILSSFLIAFENDFCKKLIKSSHFRIFHDIKSSLFSTFYTFFTTYTVIFATTFFILSLGFLIIGVDNFLKTAFFISLFDLFPVVGISFFIFPWILLEFFLGNTVKSFNLLAILVVCIAVRNILEPKILSQKIGVNPVLTLICMILGAKLFGFSGMIFAPFSLIVAKNLFETKFSSK